jgi:hypothetical protein
MKPQECVWPETSAGSPSAPRGSSTARSGPSLPSPQATISTPRRIQPRQARHTIADQPNQGHPSQLLHPGGMLRSTRNKQRSPSNTDHQDILDSADAHDIHVPHIQTSQGYTHSPQYHHRAEEIQYLSPSRLSYSVNTIASTSHDHDHPETISDLRGIYGDVSVEPARTTDDYGRQEFSHTHSQSQMNQTLVAESGDLEWAFPENLALDEVGQDGAQSCY